MRQKPLLKGEQANLFRPEPDRPQWSMVPAQDRTEIIRLLSDLIRQVAQQQLTLTRPIAEAGHE
jgi:hypothetical protein